MCAMNVVFTPAWQAVLSQPDTQWRLIDVALAVASSEYPDLDIPHYRNLITTMAKSLPGNDTAHATLDEKLERLNHFLYEEQGFNSGEVDFSDPRSSFLNDVLDNRRGLPITVSLIYLELAQTMGLAAYGINFPGHFLVGVRAGDRHCYIDAFKGGRQLTQSDLKVLLSQALEDDVLQSANLASYLKPASNHAIMVRVLRNLKSVYTQKQDISRALDIIAMILSLLPDAPEELRDRGMIYQHIDYAKGALADLSRYLQLAPPSQERGLIENMVETLQTQSTQLH